MSEFFILANSNAAPFFSDESEAYVEAETPEAALASFVADYKHPCGLYAADAWASADDYHRRKIPLAIWRSERALKRGAERASAS